MWRFAGYSPYWQYENNRKDSSDLAPNVLLKQTYNIESNSVYLSIYDRCRKFFLASSNTSQTIFADWHNPRCLYICKQKIYRRICVSRSHSHQNNLIMFIRRFPRARFLRDWSCDLSAPSATKNGRQRRPECWLFTFRIFIEFVYVLKNKRIYLHRKYGMCQELLRISEIMPF